MTYYLIASDLDRTLLPNGKQDESAQARPLLHVLAQHPQVKLVYVSGRDQSLVQQAIAEYGLPQPSLVITDVGAAIYTVTDGQWDGWQAWSLQIGSDWQGFSGPQLAGLLADVASLTLQEESKQATYKLSYYLSLEADSRNVLTTVRQRFEAQGVCANLIWSVDEPRNIGLLDILPAQADKLQALSFLREQLNVPLAKTVFAGDSGNDIAVLTSEMLSILVANADASVVAEAWQQLPSCWQDSLYHAQGGFMSMNGYYAAGVLEGIDYYFPELGSYLKQAGSAMAVN